MAKLSKSMIFKGAMIDKEKDEIVEVTKDKTKYYKLSDIIEEWNKIKDISINIKKENDLVSNIDDGEDEKE